ncbi:MAG: protein kinase [Planctomycetaceae bacterium]|nr:protein kinase [Planctomycetaceae bacterium]
MNEQSPACNDDALVALLRDELTAGESDPVLSHLESCTSCQQRISDLVASGDEWKRTAQAISACAATEVGAVPFSMPSFGSHQITWNDSMARQLLSPPSHPEMLGRLGRYEVERLIGSGGMGVVFKAFDSELNRPVAIKLLAPYLASSGPARKRFSREARAAAAVVHQHVVPIHNVETERETPFIVMQFVSGESLQDRIDREGSLELCEILRIGMQVADGLSAAHQQGLVHRDIKPSNILLEEDVDRALISDFGLARAADDASLTRTGFHPGTPQYMSPEQASGQSVDARSDLFSFGSMLYTMCTGRPPFRAENSLSVMRRITDTEPIAIREVNPAIPDWLCSIIARLMDKQKSDRFQSAREVHVLLEACLSHIQQPSAKPLPVIPGLSGSDRHSPFLKTRTGILSMIAVACLVTFWGGLFFPGVLVDEVSSEPGRSDNSTALLQSTESAETKSPAEQQSSAESKPDGSSSWVADAEYRPSAATRRVIEKLSADVENAATPTAIDTPDDQLVYINSEVTKAIAERISTRLELLHAGRVEDSGQFINELQGLFLKLKPLLRPTESTYAAYRRIAIAVWPVVLKGYPAEFNAAIVTLTEPYAAIRANDRMAEADQPTEPLGEDLQAVHALALARAGDFDGALRENRRFAKRIRVNLEKGRLPDLKVYFLGTHRSQQSLLQQSILQEACILAFNGRHAQATQVSSTAGQVEVRDESAEDQRAIAQLVITLAQLSEEGAVAEQKSGLDTDDVRLKKLVEDHLIVVRVKLEKGDFTGTAHSYRVHVLHTYKGKQYHVESVLTTDASTESPATPKNGQSAAGSSVLKPGEYVLILDAQSTQNSFKISSLGFQVTREPGFSFVVVRDEKQQAAWPVNSSEAQFIAGLFVNAHTQVPQQVPASASDSQLVSEAEMFEQLWRLKLADTIRYAAIVSTIRDDATAKLATQAISELFPLKSQIASLGRKLRRYQPEPEQVRFAENIQQQIDLRKPEILSATVKVVNEPFFQQVTDAGHAVDRASRSMLPYPVSGGMAQRGDGPQFVVWMTANSTGEIDLSDEQGLFEVHVVDDQTGELRQLREHIAGGGVALLPINSLCWLRPVPDSTDEGSAAAPSEMAASVLTWNDVLGVDAPPGYSDDALSLIQALNTSRGEWLFAGTVRSGDEEADLEATMEIQGGFRNIIRQGFFPQWQIVIGWPRAEPADALKLNVLAVPEPEGIKWMLAPAYSTKGEGPIAGLHKLYDGIWNPETGVLRWTSARAKPTLEEGDVVEKSEDSGAPLLTFEMSVKANGEIQFTDYQHTDTLRFSGKAAARIGEPVVEKTPAIAKLPGGYKIFFASSTEVCLDSESGPIIAGPRIEKIGCHEQLIFGLTTLYANSEELSDTLGYFLLDTTTGEITKGMDLATWREVLKTQGVTEPRLVGPEMVGE